MVLFVHVHIYDISLVPFECVKHSTTCTELR